MGIHIRDTPTNLLKWPKWLWFTIINQTASHLKTKNHQAGRRAILTKSLEYEQENSNRSIPRRNCKSLSKDHNKAHIAIK